MAFDNYENSGDEYLDPEIFDSDDNEDSDRTDFLDIYLKELEAIPDTTEEELEKTTILAISGDAEAQKLLIQMHLKDVVDIARLYAGQGVLMEDLIGEGNMALSLAVTQLDSIGHPSEAAGMLTRMIMDGIEEHIHSVSELNDADEKILRKVNRVLDKARELSEEYGRKVTVDELAEETTLSRKSIMDAISISGGIEFISKD